MEKDAKRGVFVPISAVTAVTSCPVGAFGVFFHVFWLAKANGITFSSGKKASEILGR